MTYANSFIMPKSFGRMVIVLDHYCARDIVYNLRAQTLKCPAQILVPVDLLLINISFIYIMANTLCLYCVDKINLVLEKQKRSPWCEVNALLNFLNELLLNSWLINHFVSAIQFQNTYPA